MEELHHHHLLSLLLLFTLLSISTASDLAALLRLGSAVRGNTLQWNQSDPSAPCSWNGVACNTTTNRVISLRLPGDRLAGEIPENTIGTLTQLQNLSLRHNSLSGQLPADLGSCTELRLLNLQGNNFSGDFSILFNLNNLVRVDLSENSFSGEISQVGNNNWTRLRFFNVSFNRLNGQIPPLLSTFPANSFTGNDLCGSPLDSCPGEGNNNSLSAGAIAGIVIGSVFGSLLILAILFLLLRKRGSSSTRNTPRVEMSSIPPSPLKQPENPITVMEYNGSGNGYSGRSREVKEEEKDLSFFGEGIGDFNLDDLLRASAEVLGKGTYGTTYKAYLEDGGEVVVKRLKNVCVSEGEFRDIVERLGELVHENVVPLRGYYYGREEKLLVFDSMPMGSLSAILHGNRGALTWEMRSTIAFQVANGLEYLHFHGVTHGNIKSSNVLLTERYGACISEFGLTQLVMSTTPNLIGYRAPEVIDSRKVSQKADVYSFGVLILELLTCKVPTDTMNEDGLDLPRWVQSIVEEKWTADVFDPELLKYENIKEQVVQLLDLGIHCAAQHPNKRPSMAEAMAQIKRICRPGRVS